MTIADAAIYLIRHAEKPSDDVNGVDETGAADAESLIPRGWQRAGAWAVYFGPSGPLPAPERVYAANDQKEKLAKDDKLGSHSRRPIETVTEAAQRLGLGTPNVTFTKDQEPELVKEIAKLDGVTLVCWQHEAIPQIAELLVGTDGKIPSPWPGDRFDVVWRFRRAAGAATWLFDQLCPQLLSGDPADEIVSAAPGSDAGP